MEQLDEIIKEFLVESYESLEQLDADLLALEDVPDDRDRLASIFRTIHTIKGTAGFLAFPKLEHLAHVGENLLVPLRDGVLGLSNPIADALLHMVDAVRGILQEIESSGVEGQSDHSSLLEELERLKSEELAASSGAAAAPAAAEATPDAAEGEPAKPEGTPADIDAHEDDASTEDASTDDAAATSEAPAVAPSAPPAAAADAKRNSSGGNGGEAAMSTSLADTTVRLDVALLDRLMNLVGELVLARNQILQFSQSSNDSPFLAASQRLNHITTELQEGVMKTRMQPIRNAWSKLPRVVRDLASACEKQVEVKMDGGDTELDKTILEAIKDPLTHIVRNSVDHGIESPENRVAAGKKACGTLLLRAFHEGGQVNVEISDDGGGINLDRVREKAIANGLVTEDQVETMSEREITNLILLPGFSTAPKVTNVSGRGVGMDVVKTNVEKIGGVLDVQSFPGRGTTLRIKIPLTLAIVPALIVTNDGERYAIPQVSLLELVRLDGARARNEIEHIHDVPVYRLRGNLLPILHLSQQLGTGGFDELEDDAAVNMVVLQAEDRQFGLIVDQVNDTQEIVVKPLGSHLNGLMAFAGATIMGDGAVALILDVLGIARQGKLLSDHQDAVLQNAADEDHDRVDERSSLLVVDPGDGTRTAIPLISVARLEEFRDSEIEHVENRPMVQYRGQIMPIISMSGSPYIDGNHDTLQVVVYHRDGRDVGVHVGTILDIVTDASQDNTAGEQIIEGRVTRLVDLERIVSTGCPDMFAMAMA